MARKFQGVEAGGFVRAGRPLPCPHRIALRERAVIEEMESYIFDLLSIVITGFDRDVDQTVDVDRPQSGDDGERSRRVRAAAFGPVHAGVSAKALSCSALQARTTSRSRSFWPGPVRHGRLLPLQLPADW